VSDVSGHGVERLEAMRASALEDLVPSCRPTVGSVTVKRLPDDADGWPRWWAVDMGTNMSGSASGVLVEGRVTPEMVVPAVL